MKALVRIFMASAVCFATYGAPNVMAAPSGIQRDLWMTPIFRRQISLDANVTYTFTTSNLQPLVAGGLPDTVIHVQNDDGNGSFLGGNDDSSGLASSVTLSVPTSRSVHVIVRAFEDVRAGTADLVIYRAGVPVFSSNIAFGGRLLSVSSGLVAGSHVNTTEQFNGPGDTMLVIVSGAAANAIAFDDDDGVELQSWLHLDNACLAGACTIVYGRFNSGPQGPATVIWDGDVHTADPDADALGTSLETVLGTVSTDADTDDDGLSDSAEVYGIEASPAVKLATWGANPLAKDVFVEVDWNQCPADVCPGSPDAWQLSTANAEGIAAMYAPDISVHLDIGRSNPATTLANWSKWGSWGGASQVDYTAYCADLTPTRSSVFHHFHINSSGDNGGQADFAPGKCMYGGNTDRVIAHELGHNLGLFHEGNSGTGKMNHKPNYLSMMNYGYTYDTSVAFSRNTLSATLNPTALNEAASGLPATFLTKMQGGVWSYTADPATGKIDWNRDGQYGSNVRGAPSWVLSNAPEATSAWIQPDIEDAGGIAFARMSSPGRFYMFSRRSSDQKVIYRHTSSFSSCSGGDPVGSCVAWVGPTLVGNSNGGTLSAPSVHPVTIGGVEKLMLVYANGSGQIWYQIGTSADVWTAPKALDTTAVGYEPALAASASGGGLRVYFQKFGVLYRRNYNTATDTWSAATWEKTATNNSIGTSFGVSIVKGFETAISGNSFYMALANPFNADKVELWRYSSSSDNWTQITTAWGATQPSTDAAPALAYVPINLSDQTIGQFYVAYNTLDSTGENIIRIAKTAGNDSNAAATSRQFRWLLSPSPIYNLWGVAGGSPELFFGLGVDQNLRGAYRYLEDSNKITFFPIADGAPNVVFKDQNDFTFLKDCLDCSLGAGGCPTL